MNESPHEAGGGAHLPPLTVVQAALRATTERLAAELAAPTEAPPPWSEFEWRTARAASVMHGVSGLLASRLIWHGPGGWTNFLREQHGHIAHRHARLQELLERIDERSRSRGLPIQALKGTALHLAGFYRPGERPMADLDLLVRPQATAQAAKTLEELGLIEARRTFKHRVFVTQGTARTAPFGEHADNDLMVELHERICEPLPWRLTDISHLLWPAEPRPGLNPYRCDGALMAHLLLHAAGAMAYRTLRLVQLHDIALLARRLSRTDWQFLLQEAPRWAWPPLSLTERYYGALVPQELRMSARAGCPRLLRSACARQQLSDVSLSRLWLEAFPGIEWSGSLAEAVGYVAQRVAPGAEVRAERRSALAKDPSLAAGDWGGLSQRRRILRALRSRTARPWPMHNVRCALAQPR